MPDGATIFSLPAHALADVSNMLQLHAENMVNVGRLPQGVIHSGDDDKTCAWTQLLGKSPNLVQRGYVILISVNQEEQALNRGFGLARELSTKQLRVMSLELGCGPAPAPRVDHS